MGKRAHTLFLLLSIILLIDQVSSQAQCTTSDDCMALYNCEEGTCVHKDLFPLTVREIITLVLIVIIAGPAHGLGAGSIMNPIVLIGFNYDASKSTMIMQALILGGSFGAFLNTFWRTNPKTGKPVIDYDLVMVIMPTILLGVALGVTAKIAAPQIVLIGCLVLIEVVTVKRLVGKALEHHRKEQGTALPSLNTSVAAINLPLLPALGKPLIQGAEGIEGMGNIELKEFVKAEENEKILEDQLVQQQKTLPVNNAELEGILKEDKRLFPPTKLFWIFLLLCWMVTMTLLRSGPILDVSHCSFRYWVLFGITLVGCYLLFLRNRSAVSRRIQTKLDNGFSSEADFLLKPGVLEQMGKITFISGIFAGFLGIGAGTIIGPYLLAFGCPPGVQGPTMAFGIVQSAFIACTVSLLLSPNIQIIELLIFFGIALGGSYFVNRTISFLIGKYQKPSINLWIMISIVGSSVIIMPLFLIWKSIENPAEMLKYRWIC